MGNPKKDKKPETINPNKPPDSYRDNELTNQQAYHTPVLLNEVIEGLKIEPTGIYVDCTFGGGGHSKAIAEKLSATGKLVAFDQDDDARKNLLHDERIIFVPQNFRHLQRFLRLHNITAVDGIMAKALQVVGHVRQRVVDLAAQQKLTVVEFA